MPNPGLDEQIKKVTLNLYESDVFALIERYGVGWTGKVRELVREHINATKRTS